MTTSGYIVIGILMLLDILTIAVCKIFNEEDFMDVLKGILLVLVAIVFYTVPV